MGGGICRSDTTRLIPCLRLRVCQVLVDLIKIGVFLFFFDIRLLTCLLKITTGAGTQEKINLVKTLKVFAASLHRCRRRAETERARAPPLGRSSLALTRRWRSTDPFSTPVRFFCCRWEGNVSVRDTGNAAQKRAGRCISTRGWSRGVTTVVIHLQKKKIFFSLALMSFEGNVNDAGFVPSFSYSRPSDH